MVRKLEHGKHRKPNKVINFAKRKPVYISFLAVFASGIGFLTALHSFANTPLQSDGGMSSYAQPGQPPTSPTGGVSGTPATLYPQSSSTDLPTSDTGGFSTADYYIDQKVTLDGPGQKLSSPNAWLLHFDITANSAGTTLQGDNGYEQITAALIDPWIDAVDGYGGSGGTTESQFDAFLRGEVEQQKAVWAKSNLFNGGNTITTYDLPTLIQDAGGAFSGRYAGVGTTEGPTFYWTDAPQAQVHIPPQTISGKAGGKIYFSDEVALETYHAIYHYEYVEVDGPNGTPIVPESAIHLQNTVTSSHTVYQTPGDPTSPAMIEVNGGNPDPGSVAPRWHYWTDGTGETTWTDANVPQSQQDYIQLPSDLAPGIYTVKLWASDYYNRVTASPATATFTVGSGSPGSGITLAVNGGNTATEPTGTTVNLNATVNQQPPAGHQWDIMIEDNSGSTINGQKVATSAIGTPTSYSTTADSQTALSNETYTAYLVDETTGQSIASNSVTASWTNGSPPGGGGSGGLCPAPYDNAERWQANPGTNGGETFYWTYNVPYPRYNAKGQFVGCGDQQTPMQQYYPAMVNSGQITGLSDDPGVPGDLWLPESASEWNQQNSYANSQYFSWYYVDEQHGWDFDGSENGGLNASQVSGTYTINGVGGYHTYGSSAQSPWVWVRPGAGLGFRMLWTGSPHSLPTSGTATFSLVNPDGSSNTWTEPLIVNEDTLNTEGPQMVGLNQSAPFADEYISAWTQLPKDLSGNDPVAWSLSSNPSVALANGAHLNVSIAFGTQNAGNISVDVPTMAATFSYPIWYMNQIHSVTVDGQTYVGTGSASDSQQ
ncbi:hypothetical protein [Alicyclobacillus fastidiosus]|uniref:Uncharacterized protein n=1 Tax=Alicyclobacillus fastidiosus TaxID=392011 RepID=A0ABV5AI28_9BACL|nr:hypothetical protein [Alicyclobacillus fastidiosus]WEH09195.1 hypothetical protein PYS47_21390 [Alicyclobacillus fastidiosus]